MASNDDYYNWLEQQTQTSSRQGYQPHQAPPRKGRDKRRRSPSPTIPKRCRREYLPPPPPPPPPPPVHSRLGQSRYGQGKDQNFGLLGNRMAMTRHLSTLFEDVSVKGDTVTLGGSMYSYFNLKTAAKFFDKRGNTDGSSHPWIETKNKHVMSNPNPKETADFIFQTAIRAPMQACTLIEIDLGDRFENLRVSNFDIDCLCTRLAAVFEDEVHKTNRDHTANPLKLLRFNASSKVPKMTIQVHQNSNRGIRKIIVMMSTDWSVKLTHSTTVAVICCLQKMYRSKGYVPDENQYAKFPLHYIDVETGGPTNTPGIIPFWAGLSAMVLNHRMNPRTSCIPAVFGDTSMKDMVTAISIICTARSAISYINAIQRGVHKGTAGSVNLDLTKSVPCTETPYVLQHDCYRNGFILKDDADEVVVRRKQKPKAARATKCTPLKVEEVQACLLEDVEDDCNSSSSSSSQLPPSPVFPVVMDDEIPTREESSDDERDEEEHPKEERSPKRRKRSLRNSRSEREESSSDEEEDGEIEPRKCVSKSPKKNESENSSSSSSSSSSDEEDDKKSTGSQSGSGSSSSSSGSSSSSSDSESEDEKKDVAEKTPPQEERPQSDSEQEDEPVPMAETAAPDVIKNDSHTSDTQSVPTITQEAVPGIVEQSQTAAQALAELVEQVTQSTTFAVDDTAADTAEPMDVEQHQQMDFMDLAPPPTPSFDMIPGLGFDDEYDFEMPDISTSMLEDILSMASKNNTK